MISSPYAGLCLVVSPKSVDRFSVELEELGALAIEQRDQTTLTSAPEGTAELNVGFLDGKTRDIAFSAILKEGGYVSIQKSDITSEGWKDGWREYFEPVVLERIQIITSWMEHPVSDVVSIVIDPGQAFGTGGHATTKAILTGLEKLATLGTLPNRVLDVGTGSGVLAIAAVKLGAKEVTAIDIDPESIRATRENAKRNGVDAFVTTELGQARDVRGAWPLVLANLDLSIFLECHEDVASRVGLDGTLVASGLLIEQIESFTPMFPNFEPMSRIENEGWSALTLKRIR